MVELVTADRPEVVCLQEVPAWALGRLGGWAGMTEVPAIARRPRVGAAALGRAMTAPHHGLIRSAFAGQGNSILVASTLRLHASAALSLTDRTGGLEARVAQRVELGLPGGRDAAVVNVHCSHGDPGETQLALALRFGEDAAPNGAVLVLAGDLNTTPERSPTLRGAGLGAVIRDRIDQVLVRGAPASARVWADEERAYGGRLLSDHAPVEAEIEVG
jgi:endonuclease/exonuclease/phosphatase family metal-dependent hydrolase